MFYITLGTVEQGVLYRSSPPVPKMGKGHTTEAGVPFRIPIMDNRIQAFSYSANPALTTSLCERDIRQAEAGPYPFPLVTLFACWQEQPITLAPHWSRPCLAVDWLSYPFPLTQQNLIHFVALAFDTTCFQLGTANSPTLCQHSHAIRQQNTGFVAFLSFCGRLALLRLLVFRLIRLVFNGMNDVLYHSWNSGTGGAIS